MKKTVFTIIYIITLIGTVFGTQWSSRVLCPDLSYYPQALAFDGDVFTYNSSDDSLNHYPYTGSYTWGTEEECTGFSDILICATISPDRTEGYALLVDGNVYYITSSDGGTTWNQESTLPDGWIRSGLYVEQISCAWNDSERWIYFAYSDGVIWGDNGDYDNPQEIDTGGFSKFVTVNPWGDYMVVGNGLDFYELTGYGNSWSGRTEIVEISGGEQIYPVVGRIDAEEEKVLIWMADGQVYRSVGDSTQAIENTSLGVIKSLFE